MAGTGMGGKAWQILRDSVEGYVNDGCLSRGAAIAYYTIFSIAPLLVIAIAIAGLAFGEEAAQGAIAGQLSGMLGAQAAEAIQAMIRSASSRSSGIIATVVGVVTLLITASGVFGELQSSLNVIWKAETPGSGSTMETVTRLMKAKAASLGLVAAMGFLLLVSLIASAGISAFGTLMGNAFPGLETVLAVVNFTVSFIIISALFAAIYKVLPDRRLEWRDVLVGAFATAFLFVLGKSLIGWYIGSSNAATSYGAAGALVIVLLWVYYSSQIFLLGAEFTRAYAGFAGSYQDAPIPAKAEDGVPPAASANAPVPKPATPQRRRGLAWRPLPPALAGAAAVLVAAAALREWRRPT